MDKRIKGAGGLSRKLLTILVLSAMATLGHAADNSIYLDQSGDTAIVTMTQDGAGNTVKGILANGNAGASTDPAKVIGDGNIVTVNQVGSGNTLSLGVNRGTSTAVDATSVSYSVTGNNAVGFIDLNNSGTGSAAGNVVSITQTGDNATGRVIMTGDSNTLSLITSGGSNNSFGTTVTGDNNTQTISATGGGGNSLATSQIGDNNSLTLTSVGATNSIIANQTGNDHVMTVVNNGSGNQYVLNQTGVTGPNLLSINTVGSGSRFNITQTNR
jgi:hypothetical protein